LPVLEAVACGVDVIVPNQGAIYSWLMDNRLNLLPVNCDELAIMSPMNNETGWVVGNVVNHADLCEVISMNSTQILEENKKNTHITLDISLSIPIELTIDHVSTSFINIIKNLI
jgi:hypothetical protein